MCSKNCKKNLQVKPTLSIIHIWKVYTATHLFDSKPFQNVQTHAFWFSEWKVMTIWKYFSRRFVAKNFDQFQKEISGKRKVTLFLNFDH
jgi:hypothetical protein